MATLQVTRHNERQNTTCWSITQVLSLFPSCLCNTIYLYLLDSQEKVKLLSTEKSEILNLDLTAFKNHNPKSNHANLSNLQCPRPSGSKDRGLHFPVVHISWHERQHQSSFWVSTVTSQRDSTLQNSAKFLNVGKNYILQGLGLQRTQGVYGFA